MNSEKRVLKITLALYRVTDRFPKDEVLTKTLREQGLKILELVVGSKSREEIASHVKVIRYQLQLAKNLKVTKSINLEVLQREYGSLAQGLAENDVANTVSREQKRYKIGDINERQEEIIEYLKEKKQAKVGDLQDKFKNISSKTIQRDLHNLVARNILAKEGEKRWTIYFIKDSTT